MSFDVSPVNYSDSDSNSLPLRHRTTNPQVYTSIWIQHDESNRLQLFFRHHLIVCGNNTAKNINEYSISSSERRFVEINLVKTTFGGMRPSPGRYDVRSNTSNTARYIYKVVSKLSVTDCNVTCSCINMGCQMHTLSRIAFRQRGLLRKQFQGGWISMFSNSGMRMLSLNQP